MEPRPPAEPPPKISLTRNAGIYQVFWMELASSYGHFMGKIGNYMVWDDLWVTLISLLCHKPKRAETFGEIGGRRWSWHILAIKHMRFLRAWHLESTFGKQNLISFVGGRPSLLTLPQVKGAHPSLHCTHMGEPQQHPLPFPRGLLAPCSRPASFVNTARTTRAPRNCQGPNTPSPGETTLDNVAR